MTKPLHTGDIIRLMAPSYGEPTGDCMVIVDQTGGLVWFTASDSLSQYRGPCFVVRRSAVQVIQRQERPGGGREHTPAARTSHGQPDREVTP